MYGVGMGTANGIKSLNSGWQVWGTSSSSKRNASVSSAASGNDMSPSASDNTNYRSNLSDSWTASRPTSGTWEDINDSATKKDFSQLDPHGQLNYARHRQATVTQVAAYTGSRIDDRSKNGQFSPQRYDNLGKDNNSSRYNSASPTRTYNGYPNQQSGVQQSSTAPGSYESLQTSQAVNDELSLALRGMVVEDEFNSRQQTTQTASLPGSHPRGPPPVHQSRAPYNAYAQTEYGPYYSVPSGVDYSYGYEAYRAPPEPSMYASPALSNATPPSLYAGVSPPTLHPGAVADLHRQQAGLFYDYVPGARPHGSQFFYPAHQPVIYPPTHSPIIAPQLGASNPGGIADKKRDLQVSADCFPESTLFLLMLTLSILCNNNLMLLA
ncbi:hypothetical protein AMATHDRAFT_135701 [Amanita thiersii Skay4041]|uniref:Uncharacterized protein n=1 Tax=Amanita thiersii Skay4041 TaxID=703135 RepID=A0A2A9NW37_9AGAR|nr:hypothetical protein AMATHDRAFT_135701 [Amanita thiersii Skay4041]